ncbi:hypothetical protein FQZ97_1076410 [compost metagenome]
MRKSRPTRAHTTRAPPTTSAKTKPVSAGSMPIALASQAGSADPEAMSKLTLSTVLTRSTAVTPRKVAKAAMPMMKKTTSDFKLPAPMRTKVLLPQPDASTMPKPNKSPPTMAESQITRLLV